MKTFDRHPTVFRESKFSTIAKLAGKEVDGGTYNMLFHECRLGQQATDCRRVSTNTSAVSWGGEGAGQIATTIARFHR